MTEVQTARLTLPTTLQVVTLDSQQYIQDAEPIPDLKEHYHAKGNSGRALLFSVHNRPTSAALADELVRRYNAFPALLEALQLCIGVLTPIVEAGADKGTQTAFLLGSDAIAQAS